MGAPDVLIIDDDELVRLTIRDILEEEGHVVAEAADGIAGVKAIQKQNPRLIICDVKMPGLNGFEVLRKIREAGTEPATTPFIFLSGLDDKKYLTAGYKIGADDYVTKPVDYDVLSMKVKAILRKQAAAEKTRALVSDTVSPSTSDEGSLSVPEPFKARLDKLMKTEGEKATGRLKIVSLEEFRDLFKGRWEKVRHKAMAISDGIVRGAMGKDDLYVQHGEDAFLILFAGADLATSQKRAEKLAVEIRQRLLGKDKDYRGIGVTADTIDVSKLAAENKKVTPDLLAREFDHQAATQIAQEKEGQASNDTSWFTTQLSVQFRPLWNPFRQLVVAFECHPFRRSAYGVFSGSAVLHGGDQDPMAVHVDAVMAAQVIKTITGKQTANEPAIMLPLHFETLKLDDFGGLMEIFKAVPQSRLLGRVAVEIIGVPEARGETSIRRVLEFVKRISARTSVRLAPEDRHAHLFKANGADTLVLDVEADWQTQTEKQILLHILDFGKRAKAQGFHTTAYGLNSLATVRSAMQAGFSLISGRVIGDIRDAPVQPYELTRKYILS